MTMSRKADIVKGLAAEPEPSDSEKLRGFMRVVMLIEFLRADIEQLTAENEMLQRELDSLTKGSDPTLH
jgi:hypothetical protein